MAAARKDTGALPSSAPHMPQKARLEIPGYNRSGSHQAGQSHLRRNASLDKCVRDNVGAAAVCRASEPWPNALSRPGPTRGIDPFPVPSAVAGNHESRLPAQRQCILEQCPLRHGRGLKVALAVFVVPNVRWPMVPCCTTPRNTGNIHAWERAMRGIRPLASGPGSARGSPWHHPSDPPSVGNRP